MYPSCKIYQGECICKDDYIDETKCNVRTRWVKHHNIITQHVKNNLNYSFDWFIVADASRNKPYQKKMEATYFAIKRPKLHDQV